MIKSFRHKGLEQFFLTGSKKGITAAHADKLRIRLTALHAATGPADMNVEAASVFREESEEAGCRRSLVYLGNRQLASHVLL
jgi:plasmid maintenance system killer protein